MKAPWLICLPFLLTCSCIDFAEQTLSYRYDGDQDTLRIFQQYEGIFGSEGGEGISSEEKAQLASLYEHGRTFFFGNWITEYNEDELRELLDEPLEKAEDEEPPTALEQEAHRAHQALARLLLEQVTVKNGSFYRDATGRLSGYQQVTIQQVTDVLAAANRSFALNILAESDPEPGAKGFASRGLLRKAARENVAFIRITGNELRFHWPMVAVDFRKAKSDWNKQLVAALGQEGAARKDQVLRDIQPILSQDIWISYLDETAIIAIGYPTNDHTRIRMELDKTYEDGIGTYVEQKYGIADQLNLDAIRKKFLQGAR